MPFPKGTSVVGDRQRYQGKKAIRSTLRTLNKESRDNPEVN